MKRTQIQLDEAMYHLVKNRAHSEGRSMASVIRDAVAQYVTPDGDPKRKFKISDFSFIGAGKSDPKDSRSWSVHHDEIWDEDWRD